MFLKDPCGIICIIITYLAILYTDYVVVRWIILQTMADSLWGTFNSVMFNTVIFLLFFSHVKAVFTDPGTVPLPLNKLDFSNTLAGFNNSNRTICTRCEMIRPPKAHHCRICQRCIRKMDHHCPWINNCVGERNQKYFLQFLLYVGVLAGYTIALIVTSWIIDCEECEANVNVRQSRIVHSVTLFLESFIFGLFACIVFTDQIQEITKEENVSSQFDKQGAYNSKKSKMFLLSEVCGRKHPILWLLPITPPPNRFEPLSTDLYV